MYQKPKIVQKTWGREVWIHNSPLYCGKILEVMPGGYCSLHHHRQKHETFYVLEGQLTLELDGMPHAFDAGSVVEIQPYTRHQFENVGTGIARIIEVSTQHFEEDSVRASLSGRRA